MKRGLQEYLQKRLPALSGPLLVGPHGRHWGTVCQRDGVGAITSPRPPPPGPVSLAPRIHFVSQQISKQDISATAIACSGPSGVGVWVAPVDKILQMPSAGDTRGGGGGLDRVFGRGMVLPTGIGSHRSPQRRGSGVVTLASERRGGRVWRGKGGGPSSWEAGLPVATTNKRNVVIDRLPCDTKRSSMSIRP